MLLMIESGIRGEIATISHRHAKANNEYMRAEFDPNKESKFISYLDINGFTLGRCRKHFQRLDLNYMTKDEIDYWKHLSCILDVDLEYPEDLHNLHNDYPLAPERVKMRNVEKLIRNLHNKTNYVVHYEHLKLYENIGLKIAKIHRGIKFEESAWLEEYINLNTQLRIEARQCGNNFEVDFFQTNEQI